MVVNILLGQYVQAVIIFDWGHFLDILAENIKSYSVIISNLAWIECLAKVNLLGHPHKAFWPVFSCLCTHG